MGLFTSNTAIATKNIFISYRVSDTAGETGRLVDTLKQYFHEEQIFIDIEKIEPGVDFTVAISRSLEACDVLLAIIGPNWQGVVSTTTNKSRIHNADDWVRIEISTALKRNIRVVPVLVDGGSLPAEDELPEDLKPLVRRQAYEISNKRWKYDTEQLIRFLIKLGIPTKPIGPPAHTNEKSWWSKNYLWVTITGLALIIISALVSNISERDPVDPFIPGNDPKTVTPQQVLPNSQPAQNNIESNDPNTVAAPPSETENVNGIWYDANGLYYLDIIQNGNTLSVTSYSIAGQRTGQGSGSINNNRVSVSVNVVDFGTINIDASLSSDKLNLNGTTKIENNGASYSEALHLIKR